MEFIFALVIFTLGFCFGRMSVGNKNSVPETTSTPATKQESSVIAPSVPTVTPKQAPIPTFKPEPVVEIPGDASLFSYERCTYEETEGIEITGFIGFDTGKIVIPNEIDNMPVLNIGEKAFFQNDIREVVLPSSLRKIGDRAFGKCTNLRSINIPQHVNIIDKFAFSETSNLQNICLPEELTELASGAFWSSGISRINFPASLKKIPSLCCDECYNLRSVIIAEGVTEIGSSAFAISQSAYRYRRVKNNLTHVIIPKSVIKIDFDAFKDRTESIFQPSTILAFKGMHTAISKKIFGQINVGADKIIVYVQPGSETQKTARSLGFTVKPLSECLYM